MTDGAGELELLEEADDVLAAEALKDGALLAEAVVVVGGEGDLEDEPFRGGLLAALFSTAGHEEGARGGALAEDAFDLDMAELASPLPRPGS